MHSIYLNLFDLNVAVRSRHDRDTQLLVHEFTVFHGGAFDAGFVFLNIVCMLPFAAGTLNARNNLCVSTDSIYLGMRRGVALRDARESFRNLALCIAVKFSNISKCLRRSFYKLHENSRCPELRDASCEALRVLCYL